MPVNDLRCYISHQQPSNRVEILHSLETTPFIPVLRAQFINHAILKYLHLLGILAFKVFN
jgi:hypothetical protein